MSPIALVLISMLLGQEAPANPAPPEPAAAPAPAQPAIDPMLVAEQYPIPAGAPADDYGLVAWCFGALDGHMRLYDKIIGEVEKIEIDVAKIPGAPPVDMDAYKAQREAGKTTLKDFRKAMEAAEKASPNPIQPYGLESLRKGASIWTKAPTADRKFLAREWMSWGLPGRCVPTAERLQARSALFGQALGYNANPQPVVAPPPPEVTVDPTTGGGEPVAAPEGGITIDDLMPSAEEVTEEGVSQVPPDAPPEQIAPNAEAAPPEEVAPTDEEASDDQDTPEEVPM